MIDIARQVAYWRDGAREDWDIAQDLVQRGRIRHGLFLAHLALEKALKAHVCRQTNDVAPRIHNLVRLSELAGLALSPDHRALLIEMNPFNLEGRYPDMLTPPPLQADAQAYLARAIGVFEWLINPL